MCGRSLQIALLCGLLTTIHHASAATSTQLGLTLPSSDAVTDQSFYPLISVDPANMVFDYTSCGTLNFSTANEPTGDEAEQLVKLSSKSSKRHVLEEAPTISIQSNRAGEFVVPIPAIGIGWMLLIGAGMYRIGCKVLRVKQ